jgi:PII-like signaling protein
MLLVFMDETDKWKEEKLYQAIVRRLEKHGIAGATVIAGIIGYGRHRRIHSPGLFGVTDEKPVTVLAIDQEDKIRAVLPKIVPMVKQGLVTLVDTEVIATGEPYNTPPPAAQ